MLSNKLTFSLASLVVLTALVFVATPVMADTETVGIPILTSSQSAGYLVYSGTRPTDTNGTTTANDPTDDEFMSSPAIVVSNWQDLNDFFLFGGGGTIDLVAKADDDNDPRDAPATLNTATTVPGKYNFIISEIQWGGVENQQWIEIYVPQDVTLGGSDQMLLYLVFTEGDLAEGTVGEAYTWDHNKDGTADATGTLVDRFSTWGFGQWTIVDDGAYGQSGRIANPGATPPVTAKTYISMQRKIDYGKTVAEHLAGTGVPDGTLSGSWEKSKPPRKGLMGARIGNPGEKPPTPITAGDKPTPSRAKFKITEVGNNEGYDWVEIVNTTTAKQNLKKFELSIVTGTTAAPKDESLVKFPDNDDHQLEAGEILVITSADPTKKAHPLALGRDLKVAASERAVDKNGTTPTSLYYEDEGLVLPEDGKFLLILRDESKLGKSEKIHDVVGAHAITVQDADFNTGVWPLQATPKPHGNVFGDNTDGEFFKDGRVYKRDKDDSFAEKAWSGVGYTGIGYKRSAAKDNKHGGTPGFANNAFVDKGLPASTVTISEIMANSGGGRLPQWIELRNMSATQGVNLDAWKLRVENVSGDDVDSRRDVTIDLPNGYRIPPNQTIVIATRRAGRSDNQLTDQRYMTLWDDDDARSALEVENSRFVMLSMKGFTLKLFEKDQNVSTATPVDMVMVPEEQLVEAVIGTNRERISLVRAYSTGIPGNLFSAQYSEQVVSIPTPVYYGSASDIGTPGWYPGGALPVSLSSFRPERDKATGEIVVRWVTQSELNNAGFNILRSETKNGDFTVVNVKGIIPGHGTTSEKHVYAWTDTTAKPNVVYYYQIEDVSLDGERTTLATTHLRGNVNAAGKLTTTWGDLKTQ